MLKKSELGEKIAKMYKVDPKTVILYGFKTRFGGGKSSGFALIYDDVITLKKSNLVTDRLGTGTRQRLRPVGNKRKNEGTERRG